MNDSAQTLGQRLCQRRWDERRIRQRDLAAAAGLSPGYLSQLEHDTARATEPTLRRLALVLGLDEFALVRQAAAEGRLSSRFGGRGRADVQPCSPPPVSVPASPPRPTPTQRWLTTAEAAAVTGLTPESVRQVIRAGRLRPAMRVHRPGEKGPPRWLVAAAAALRYRRGNEGYAPPSPAPAPKGFMTIKAFAAASGLAWATLYRRMDAQEIASVKRGRRRFIPAGELARVLEAKKRSA